MNYTEIYDFINQRYFPRTEFGSSEYDIGMGKKVVAYIGKYNFKFLVWLNDGNIVVVREEYPHISDKIYHDKIIIYLGANGNIIDNDYDHYYLSEDESGKLQLEYIQKINLSPVRQGPVVEYFDGRLLQHKGLLQDLETGETENRLSKTENYTLVNPYDPCVYLTIGSTNYLKDANKIVKTYDSLQPNNFNERMDFLKHYDEYLNNTAIVRDEDGNLFYLVKDEIRFKYRNSPSRRNDHKVENVPKKKNDLINAILDINDQEKTESELKKLKIYQLENLLLEYRLRYPKSYVLIDKIYQIDQSVPSFFYNDGFLIVVGNIMYEEESYIRLYDVRHLILAENIKIMQEEINRNNKLNISEQIKELKRTTYEVVLLNLYEDLQKIKRV